MVNRLSGRVPLRSERVGDCNSLGAKDDGINRDVIAGLPLKKLDVLNIVSVAWDIIVTNF